MKNRVISLIICAAVLLPIFSLSIFAEGVKADNSAILSEFEKLAERLTSALTPRSDAIRFSYQLSDSLTGEFEIELIDEGAISGKKMQSNTQFRLTNVTGKDLPKVPVDVVCAAAEKTGLRINYIQIYVSGRLMPGEVEWIDGKAYPEDATWYFNPLLEDIPESTFDMKDGEFVEFIIIEEVG
ncbi:MAG: hypothetical protein LBL87_05930 [Ruminococcus sp.]|jgi:hypothetical protein|nr:hypothetical protein [Ruminococcus sp.]